MKDIIRDLASKKNLKEFYAYIYTDPSVLEYYYNTPLSDNVAQNVKSAKEMSTKSETALVVYYSGRVKLNEPEIDTSDKGYNIRFFINATKENPIVGKYVGVEQLKP